MIETWCWIVTNLLLVAVLAQMLKTMREVVQLRQEIGDLVSGFEAEVLQHIRVVQGQLARIKTLVV